MRGKFKHELAFALLAVMAASIPATAQQFPIDCTDSKEFRTKQERSACERLKQSHEEAWDAIEQLNDAREHVDRALRNLDPPRNRQPKRNSSQVISTVPGYCDSLQDRIHEYNNAASELQARIDAQQARLTSHNMRADAHNAQVRAMPDGAPPDVARWYNTQRNMGNGEANRLNAERDRLMEEYQVLSAEGEDLRRQEAECDRFLGIISGSN